jgi:hypothetical protein
MRPEAPERWAEWNRDELLGEIADVRERLAQLAGAERSEAEQGEARRRRAPQAAERRPPGGTALDLLCARLQLTGFERQVVVLAAGAELDHRLGALLDRAPMGGARGWATFGLALKMLADPHWDALAPSRPLRRYALLDLDRATRQDGLVRAPLRLAERVLQFLLGVSCLDERLLRIVRTVEASPALTASRAATARRVAAAWSGQACPVVLLCGEDRGARSAVAAAACAALGRTLLAVQASSLPLPALDRDEVLTLLERELLLRDAALLVELHELDADDHVRAALALVDQLEPAVLVSCREPPRALRRTAVRMEVPRSTGDEQAALWRRALGPAAARLDGAIDRVIGNFRLDAGTIFALGAVQRTGGTPGQTLWDACREQARPRLDDLAQRLEPAATWADLVLPAPVLDALREIGAHARTRVTVAERWGFARKGTRGLGVSALFSGASGTGKTMAAEVLAGELSLDLYRIDLSQVMSKWVGETEKNLRRIFDAAEGAGAVLLFDEADALFGKRTEVKDSHDRFANVEVSYLLQRMDSHRGLAILTTNLREAIDPAFLRRLRFIVAFPFPDEAQRAEIWRRTFPAEVPRDGVDERVLARMHLSGGNIRTVALGAASLAADAGEPVRMAHVLRAAQREYAKLERPLTELNLRNDGGRA